MRTITAKDARVNLLHGARRLIANNIERYLCVALSTAYFSQCDALPSNRWQDGAVYRDASLYLKAYIECLLEGSETVDGWLSSRGIPYKELTRTNMRHYRLRWIDRLIKEMGD